MSLQSLKSSIDSKWLDISNQYAGLFKMLDWLFLGQLAFCIEQNVNGIRKASLLSQDRRVGVPELYKIFVGQKSFAF